MAMSRARQLHLNLLFNNAGNFSSAWRWPDSDPAAFYDVNYHVRTARLLEKGTFDAIFYSDVLALNDTPECRPFQSLEPTILLTSIAAATTHLGLIGTISSSYNDPFNIARRIASLDHVSGGRAGINVVTTADAAAARNFGQADVFGHAERYARGAEFIEVLQKLWDSWEDDAVVGDKHAGRLIDPARLHSIDHHGKYYDIEGPLTVPRAPQGRPVVVQAGASADGRDVAARHAEIVFTAAHSIEDAADYAIDVRSRAQLYGREPNDIAILPGLVTVLGGTEAEAKARAQALWELVPIRYGLNRLAHVLGVDPDRLDLDRPLPSDLARPRNGSHTMFDRAVKLARDGNLTVRELIRAQGGGATMHRVIVGTPEQVADSIESWFATGHVDGFNIVPDVIASGLEPLIDEVVPLLRRKGIYRGQYEGTTLREHYGLPRPPSSYARH
jgi:FMN-dependent oxidoreductase (nitrilotriacetate monooxygenase family)